MSTLPGMPNDEEDPEPDALPVEPDDGTGDLGVPPKPGDEAVEPPKA